MPVSKPENLKIISLSDDKKFGYFSSKPADMDKFLKSPEGMATVQSLQAQAVQMGGSLNIQEIRRILEEEQYNQRFNGKKPGLERDALLHQYPQTWADKFARAFKDTKQGVEDGAIKLREGVEAGVRQGATVIGQGVEDSSAGQMMKVRSQSPQGTSYTP